MLFFYLLAILLVFTSYGVIVARNPVISMLYLVLVFLQSSIIFLLLGAEFLFVLFLIVYVGAVAILFLFVIMLLNLRVVEGYNSFYNYMPIGLFVGFYFFLFVIFFLTTDFSQSLSLDFSLLDSHTQS
jgi:NADH-quinone oxidoreductase subunit J